MAPKQATVRFKEQTYEVESQTPTLTDKSIEEARKLIGVDFRAARALLEITRDGIRDYCNYIGSTNPLFLDEEYARKSRWGGLFAPPAMVGMTPIAPGLRGVQWIGAGVEWEFYRLMRPGDMLVQRGCLVDAQERLGKTVPRMILQTGEVTHTNQRSEVVAKSRTHVMRTPRRSADSGMGMSYEKRTPSWSPEALAAIDEEVARETRRGAEARYWEDVKEGEVMPSVLYGPLRVTEIAFSASLPDSGSYSGEGVVHAGAHVYQLLNRRRHPADTFVDPVTGAQDHPHRGHWEQFMATEVGMPGIYDIGAQRLAWTCRYITDWMGDDAFLKKLTGWLRRPNVVGDVTRLKGKVKRKWVEGGEHLVECEFRAENQEGEVTMPGHAVVSLLSRTLETRSA